MQVRLQKILAESGVGSRRECEVLISEGRVEVNRQVQTKLGTKVDSETDTIRVDGETIKVSYKMVFAVNKPKGVISSNQDPDGRMRVIDLIATDQRIYNVGRLDKDSQGLIIVTNDGELANRLTHPKYGVEKTYLIQVQGFPAPEQMDSLIAGVHMAEGVAQIKSYQFKRRNKNTTEIEIVLNEGRNREIRRLLASIGHKVITLHRVGIGSFFMTDIPGGGNRRLSEKEIGLLQKNPRRKQQKPMPPPRKKPASKNESASPSRHRAETRSKTVHSKKKSASSNKYKKSDGTKSGAKSRGSKSGGYKSSGSKSVGTEKSNSGSRKGTKKTTSKPAVKKSSKKTTGKKVGTKTVKQAGGRGRAKKVVGARSKRRRS